MTSDAKAMRTISDLDLYDLLRSAWVSRLQHIDRGEPDEAAEANDFAIRMRAELDRREVDARALQDCAADLVGVEVVSDIGQTPGTGQTPGSGIGHPAESS